MAMRGLPIMDEIHSMWRRAIINRNVAVPRYGGCTREMCPHMIGTTRRGKGI